MCQNCLVNKHTGKIMRLLTALLIASCVLTSVSAQTTKVSQAAPKSNLSMVRLDGSSIKTDLGYGVVLNSGSTLKREWFQIRDEDSPVQFPGGSYYATGADVIYKSEKNSGNYQYRVYYQLVPKEPVSAVEVRVHVLDVFGKLIKTLSSTQIVDFSELKTFEGAWRIWSENEASEAFASVAYVAQVRTTAGRVYEVDKASVLEQVRKVSKRITEADLEPKKDPQAK